MVCGRRRLLYSAGRRALLQLDGLAVGGVEGRLGPVILEAGKLRLGTEPLVDHELLERVQPVLVVTIAEIGIASLLRRRDLC